jgi:hypothetical protein
VQVALDGPMIKLSVLARLSLARSASTSIPFFIARAATASQAQKFRCFEFFTYDAIAPSCRYSGFPQVATFIRASSTRPIRFSLCRLHRRSNFQDL